MRQLAGVMGVSGLAINRLVGRGESPKRVPLGQILQLGKLESATSAEDMDLQGWRTHSLQDDFAGCSAVSVDEN
jgi:hypothetical protein